MLVGREVECARIDALVMGLRDGRGRTLVLRGEPGIGKTALLAYAAEESELRGVRVVRARGVEAEADLRFAGVVELLRPLVPLLEALPAPQAEALRGVLGIVPRLDGKLLIGVAMLSLLSVAAEECPLVGLVDDAHWLDEASAEVLLFAARRLQDDPVALLFAARIGEPRRFDAPGVEELVLAGLGGEEARDLLAGAGHELAPAVADALQVAVRGNPLALLELPHALHERQRAGLDPLTEPLPVTETVQQAFARRIERLAPETRRALLVAAAEPSGRSASVERGLLTLGLDARALEEAEDAGLLRLLGGDVVFRHPLVRAAAYHGGLPSDRRRAHRALAAAAADSRDVDGRAWHLAAAAAGMDEEAAAALEAAGDRAKAQGTLTTAATAFERAAALSPDPERRAQRLRRAARVYGRLRGEHGFERGRAVVAEALELTGDLPLAAELQYWRGYFELDRNPQRAHDVMLEQARSIASHDLAYAARVASEAAMYAIVYFDPERALAASALARSLARRAEGAADAYVVLARSLALIANGRVAAAAPLRAAAERVMARFEQMVDATGDYADAQMIYSWIAMDRAALLVADPDQLRRRAAAIARQRGIWGPLGDVVALFVAGQYGGRIDYDLGRWDDARAELSEAAALYRELGEDESPGLRNTLANLAELAAARGAEAECRASVGAAAEISGWPFPFAGISGAAALGLFALGQGEYEGAVAEFERVLLPRMGAFLLSHEVADAIEAYARSGRRADARRWLEPFATQARASGWPWAQARAAHLKALLTDDAFDEPFAAALAIHEQAQQPFPRARSELAYAERLRRAGRRREAREQAHAALATFEQLGAEPWGERAAAELRATGERVLRRRDGDRSRLTPQELQVALVVARGATNKEAAARLYLSPKTIEKHLGSVYAKLGLRSRVELARAFYVAASSEPESAE
jgi:DNA-binding CsgD family transcriptional regulator